MILEWYLEKSSLFARISCDFSFAIFRSRFFFRDFNNYLLDEKIFTKDTRKKFSIDIRKTRSARKLHVIAKRDQIYDICVKILMKYTVVASIRSCDLVRIAIFHYDLFPSNSNVRRKTNETEMCFVDLPGAARIQSQTSIRI